MTEYYIYKTQPNDRWDTIAYKFYGNCYLYNGIIAENPHIPITPVITAGTVVKIPKIEKNIETEGLPLWKRI